MYVSGPPRAVQSNLEQEQLWGLGFRQVLAKHVLVFVSPMGHILKVVSWTSGRTSGDKLANSVVNVDYQGISLTISSIFVHGQGAYSLQRPQPPWCSCTKEAQKRCETKLGVVLPRTISDKEKGGFTVQYSEPQLFRGMVKHLFCLAQHMESSSSYRQNWDMGLLEHL